MTRQADLPTSWKIWGRESPRKNPQSCIRNTLYTAFIYKMKVLDQMIFNVLSNTEILRFSYDVDVWLRLNLCFHVEYYEVKSCFCTFFLTWGTISIISLRWIIPELCSSGIKDCCQGLPFDEVKGLLQCFESKTTYLKALGFHIVEHHLFIIWYCFWTPIIQKCSSDLTIYLRGDWNGFCLLPLLFKTSSTTSHCS